MDKKRWNKELLPFIICAALFLTVLVLDIFLGQKPSKSENQGLIGNVAISEIMSNNRTYPDPSGRALDYIEISNLSDTAVDISNYKLSDDKTTIGYTFPQGTVLQPNSSIVCWCDSQGDENYATFGISKEGNETIYLYNSANVVVDQVAVPALEQNQPYLRSANGDWSAGSLASPGFANTAEGNEAWLASIGYEMPNVYFSEVQASARYTWLDEAGTTGDWIELHNAGEKAVVLDGGYLSDDPTDALKWQIPQLTIEAGGYALIRCGGDAQTDADFSLSSNGGQVLLTSRYNSTIATVDYPALERDSTWALDDSGTYDVTAQPTPGFENNVNGYEDWLHSIGVPVGSVVISEIQTANRSAILDSLGQLSDWIELYNPGTDPVVLDGCFLTDDVTDPFKWQIEAMTLKPGEYALIPCTGKKGNPAEASFSLSRSGCTVLLSGPVGNAITQVECPAMAEDRSWQLLPDGTYMETERFSPGFENTDEAHAQFRSSQQIYGALAVSEVMPSNGRYLLQRNGEYYDWIELKNVSNAAVDLAQYAISDSSSDLQLFSLPQQELAPGETVVIICSGNAGLSGSYIHAPFTLNREECWVYVTHKELGISDYVRIAGVPVMGSAGRTDGSNEVVYFGTPTPGAANEEGMAAIADAPVADVPGGVYNDVKEIKVTLSGEGPIYYTLNGNEPTMNSYLYTEPLVLTETTVIRAKSYPEGKLPSPITTASYIINENHTLPVVAISANYRELFGSDGIYTNFEREQEIPCNLTLYEGDAGFTIDCGLKLYGHTGLKMPKKSFKVNFRSRYGENVLNYPVYGEDGPFLYDSLCIRAGQDYPQAIFRDELFTSLCRDMSDSVLAQRDKFCILYVNGEYFGIYCMKEAFNELFYAQNRDVRKESVENLQAPVLPGTGIYDFMNYLESHDMTVDENYEYACSVINIDSLIDWMIIQGYTANGDVQQNLRYFRSTDNGNRYEMAFYDLDWAFYVHMPFTDVLSDYHEAWQHLRITQNLMENPNFRQKFLERTSYHMQNTLSNENVLARIDYYQNLLSPEIIRERDKWGSNYDAWVWNIDYIRNFITNRDHLGQMVDHLVRYIGLTKEEMDTYFWRWK